jgi:hypothetical protein
VSVGRRASVECAGDSSSRLRWRFASLWSSERGHVVAVGRVHQPFQVGCGNIQCRKHVGVKLAGHHLPSAQNRPGPRSRHAEMADAAHRMAGFGLCSARKPRRRSLSQINCGRGRRRLLRRSWPSRGNRPRLAGRARNRGRLRRVGRCSVGVAHQPGRAALEGRRPSSPDHRGA